MTSTTELLRITWATRLANKNFKAKQAVRGDDDVIHVLFSQQKKRPPQRNHLIATLEADRDDPISEDRTNDFRVEFEAVKRHIIANQPNIDEFEHRVRTFLERGSIQAWRKATIKDKNWTTFTW